jgi:DNA-binding transcriptional ArsR family regulator
MKRALVVKDAVSRFAALAQETRLEAFLLLVKAGNAGVMQGELARKLKIPPQTLSFHLKQLASAGLVRTERKGTTIYYSVHFAEALRLLNFLSQKCCAGSEKKSKIPESSVREKRL